MTAGDHTIRSLANDSAPAVHVHVHLAMTGTFPLRVADLFFTDGGVLVPEYEYLTPLFGIVGRQVPEVSTQARKCYRQHGVGGLIEEAERVHRIPYEEVDCVRFYDESGAGRPKLAVDVVSGPPYAYRIHAPVDDDALAGALRSLGERRGFEVRTASTLGFSPLNSLRRFLADR